MNLESVCGVILTSNNPERLAAFYSAVFDVKFQKEHHGDLLEHFGVDIGKVHLGIHPLRNMNRCEAGNASITIAYHVKSLEKVLHRLTKLQAIEVLSAHDEGFGMVASYKDPDGNVFEVVELSYNFEST